MRTVLAMLALALLSGCGKTFDGEFYAYCPGHCTGYFESDGRQEAFDLTAGAKQEPFHGLKQAKAVACPDGGSSAHVIVYRSDWSIAAETQGINGCQEAEAQP